MAQLAQIPNEIQLRSLFDAKVRRGIFNPVLRYLPVDIAEDRLQDAIAQTWVMYRRYALEKGKLLPDAILVHSCGQRAVDPNRFFVPCEGSQRRRDALDFRNFVAGRVEILHLDGVVENDACREGDRALTGLAEAMSATPARKIHSAIDLEAWLDGLSDRDRDMLAGRMAGFALAEVAADLGVCLSTVFSRTKQLGEELAIRAGVDIDGTSGRRGGRRSRAAATVQP